MECVTFTVLLNESTLENSSEGQRGQVNCVDSLFFLAFKISTDELLSPKRLQVLPEMDE